MAATPINKICFIISRSWSWPILTLSRRSGEHFRTVRSSSFILLKFSAGQFSIIFVAQVFLLLTIKFYLLVFFYLLIYRPISYIKIVYFSMSVLFIAIVCRCRFYYCVHLLSDFVLLFLFCLLYSLFIYFVLLFSNLLYYHIILFISYLAFLWVCLHLAWFLWFKYKS